MATDIFLNFFRYDAKEPAFKGESVVPGHVGEIRAQSLTWGYNQHVSIGAQGAGTGGSKVEFGQLYFTKSLDSTSPAMYQELASGRVFAKIVITMRKNGVDSAVFTLGGAAFSSIDGVVGTETPDPVERIGLTYGAVIWQVKADPNKPLPSPTYGWSRVKNVAVTDPIVK
jgi:type VI secretion system secreted protein Hcp